MVKYRWCHAVSYASIGGVMWGHVQVQVSCGVICKYRLSCGAMYKYIWSCAAMCKCIWCHVVPCTNLCGVLYKFMWCHVEISYGATYLYSAIYSSCRMRRHKQTLGVLVRIMVGQNNREYTYSL